MTGREYLNRIRKVVDEVEGEKLVLEKMLSECEGVSVVPTGVIRTSGGSISQTEDRLLRYSDRVWELRKLIDRELAMISVCEVIIRAMPDRRLAAIIRCRYISRMPWSRISMATGLKKSSLVGTYRAKALKMFDETYNMFKTRREKV